MMSQPKVSGRRFLVRPPTVCRTSDSRGAGRMDDHARDEASRFLSLGRSVPQIGNSYRCLQLYGKKQTLSS